MKILAGLWLLSAIPTVVSAKWLHLDGKVEGFGAAMLLNTLWFLLAWIIFPHWAGYIFVMLLILNFGYVFNQIDKYYRKTFGT